MQPFASNHLRLSQLSLTTPCPTISILPLRSPLSTQPLVQGTRILSRLSGRPLARSSPRKALHRHNTPSTPHHDPPFSPLLQPQPQNRLRSFHHASFQSSPTLPFTHRISPAPGRPPAPRQSGSFKHFLRIYALHLLILISPLCTVSIPPLVAFPSTPSPCYSPSVPTTAMFTNRVPKKGDRDVMLAYLQKPFAPSIFPQNRARCPFVSHFLRPPL
jgi:hypothetical protein